MYIDTSNGTRKKITDNDKPGLKTLENGEIFNIEYDNIAGGKCFSIINKANHGFIATDITTNINNINPKVIINSTANTLAIDSFTKSDGACPWLLFDTTISAGEYIIKDLAPELMDYGFYLGINSTNNDDLIFIDSDNYKLKLLETSILYFYWGNREHFGTTVDDGSSYMPTAGYRAFSIESGVGTYTLDSIEGIEIGDIISLKIGANYDFYTNVVYIDSATNSIVCNHYTDGTAALPGTLWLPYKPNLGTKINGGAEHSEGYDTIALQWASHGEGFGTLAAGRYSHTEGSGTRAGYAAHA